MLQNGPLPVSPFGANSPQRALAEMKDKIAEIIETKSTGYLWISLGLYGLIAACGLVTSTMSDNAPPLSSQGQATSGFRGATAPGAQGRQPPKEPLVFGPDITPPEPQNAPVVTHASSPPPGPASEQPAPSVHGKAANH